MEAALGYGRAWLLVADDEKVEELRLIDVSGSQSEAVWEVIPVIKVKGDAMLEEIVRSDEPVVVLDARTDPRTDKKVVALLENRTIINVPLRLLDKPFGAFGIGTFGDAEGCREPTREQLDYLVGMASQLSVAAGRIRFLEERKRAAADLTSQLLAFSRQQVLVPEVVDINEVVTRTKKMLERILRARTILRRAGYHVIETSGSGQALLAAEQYRGRIHLLLSDVIMPQIGGPELAQRLSVTRSEMKVLYMSGYTDNVVIHHGLVDSTIAFVQKPLTPDLLLGKVRWALDRPSRSIQPLRPTDQTRH